MLLAGCASEQAGRSIALAPHTHAIVQGQQDAAGTLATARALLGPQPGAGAERFDPAQRQAGDARVLWLRVVLPPLASDAVWTLRLTDVRLDRVTLYRLGPGGELRSEQAGELVPASQWSQRTRLVGFRLGPGRGAESVAVLRIENALPYWLDLAALDDNRFAHEERDDTLLLAAYFGVMGFALLYSLLQFGFTRDRLYGWYALYLLVMAMRQDLATGVSRSFWLPDAPEFFVGLRELVLLSVFPAGLLLVRSLLPPPLVGLRLHRAGTVAIVLSLLLALAQPALPRPWSWPLYNAYGLATMGLIGAMLARAWQPGLRQVHGVALGFVVIAVTAVVPMLVNLAWLPPSPWSANALLVGSMLEALILAVALSMGLSGDLAVELARRYGAAPDPASGFHGAALLPRLVHALLLRHRRTGEQAAVIALDVSNAQDLALHHGKECFDAMVLAMRRLVLEHARESDVPLRLGRTRFALLMTGTAGAHQVLAVAQRIIDQGLHHCPELPPSEHLRLHAVVALLPEHVTARGGGLLPALNAALDQIRPGSGLTLRELGTALP